MGEARAVSWMNSGTPLINGELTPEKWLRRTIVGGRYRDEWEELACILPACADQVCRLASYIGDGVCAPSDEPLIELMIGDGLSSALSRGAESSWEVRELIWMRGLLHRVPLLLDMLVHTKDDHGHPNHIWSPLMMPLMDWWRAQIKQVHVVARDRKIDSRYVQVSPADFRSLVFFQTVRDNQLERLVAGLSFITSR